MLKFQIRHSFCRGYTRYGITAVTLIDRDVGEGTLCYHCLQVGEHRYYGT